MPCPPVTDHFLSWNDYDGKVILSFPWDYRHHCLTYLELWYDDGIDPSHVVETRTTSSSDIPHKFNYRSWVSGASFWCKIQPLCRDCNLAPKSTTDAIIIP